MDQTQPLMPGRPLGPGAEARPGLTANALKLIAVAAMLIDHTAAAFVPATSALGIVMHFIGRITGPTMFYFIAEGYRHTRNPNRYTLRLALFALVSWPAFFYFMRGALPGAAGFTPFGVIYTLLLALLAVRARHEIQNGVLKAVVIAGLVLLSAFGDWAFYGIAITLVFDIFHDRPKMAAIVYSVIVASSVLPMVSSAITLSTADPALAGQMLVAIGGQQAGTAPASLDELVWMLWATAITQLGQLVPLALVLRCYNGRRGGGGAAGKWFFYVVYPLHLLVLGLLRWVVFA